MISAINIRVNHVPTKLTSKSSKNALKLKDRIRIGNLKGYIKNFLLSPNKVSNNAAFLWARQIAQFLIKEFGPNNIHNTMLAFMKAIRLVG